MPSGDAKDRIVDNSPPFLLEHNYRAVRAEALRLAHSLRGRH